jgi:hypothetical protein
VSASNIRRPSLAVAVLVATAVCGSSQAAAPGKKLVVYAVPTTAQFMNHADDRLRGMSTNPFNIRTQVLIITTKGKEKGHGPFPGDDILYSFKLFADPKLGKRAGRAIFTCYFDFVKRATCDAYFELAGGVLLSTGQVVFNGSRFTMAVTGGTGRYLGATGEMKAAPAAKNAERLEVGLLGPR